MPDPITVIGDVAVAAGKIADVVKQRSDQLNTPEQRANAEAEQIEKDRDAARKAVADGDPDELAKGVSP